MSEVQAVIESAKQCGYSVTPWPVSRGGGVLVYDAPSGYWLLVGCKSERWREAWGQWAQVCGHLPEIWAANGKGGDHD